MKQNLIKKIFGAKDNILKKIIGKIKDFFGFQEERVEEKTKDKKVVTLNELENKEKQKLKKVFLHFTRKNNQESIEKIGLDPNVKKENEGKKDIHDQFCTRPHPLKDQQNDKTQTKE